MIEKAKPFAKPIVIEFTKLEAEAVSYWLDDIDWDDIHIATDGCSGCTDEAHYFDTDNFTWNRVEGQAWKSDSHTLTVFDEVGFECLMRTKDYCAEAAQPERTHIEATGESDSLHVRLGKRWSTVNNVLGSPLTMDSSRSTVDHMCPLTVDHTKPEGG